MFPKMSQCTRIIRVRGVRIWNLHPYGSTEESAATIMVFFNTSPYGDREL